MKVVAKSCAWFQHMDGIKMYSHVDYDCVVIVPLASTIMQVTFFYYVIALTTIPPVRI